MVRRYNKYCEGEIEMEFKVEDMVRFVNCEKHLNYPECYPAPGTIGVVCCVDDDGGLEVRWPSGSTSGNDTWWCVSCDVDQVVDIKKLKHYVKRPVQVTAVLLDTDNFDQALQWCGGCCHTTDLPGGDKAIDGLVIHTLEGDHVAKIGDYIIRGVKGEFYPCKPDIFNETYKEVQNDD